MSRPYNVYVQVWCEIDPTLNVRVDRRTGECTPEEGDILTRVSPLGRAGVAAALDLAGADVTAFAIGEAHRDALRHALAAGATSAVLLSLPGEAEPNERGQMSGDQSFALPLANWLREQTANLIVMDRLAGLVAGHLGWSHFAGVDQLEITGGRLHAIRHLGRGEREIVSAEIPAAVRLNEHGPPAPYINRHRLTVAGEGEIREATLPSYEHQPQVEIGALQAVRLRTRGVQRTPKAPARGMDRLQALMSGTSGASSSPQKADESREATPDEMADEFVRYLAHHQLLPPTERDS